MNITERPITLYDNSERSTLLLVLYVLQIIVLIIGLFVFWHENQMFTEALAGVQLSESDVDSLIGVKTVLLMALSGVQIFSLVYFLSWFRRAYGNLHRLRFLPLKHKEEMTVYSWFIPIINIFRPALIMNELWQKTKDGIKHFDSSYSNSRGEIVIGVWWILLLSNFAGYIYIYILLLDDSKEALVFAGQVIAVFDVVAIILIMITMKIVHTISKMEESLRNEVKSNGGRVIKKN